MLFYIEKHNRQNKKKIFDRQLFPAELDRKFDKGSAIVFQPLITNLELLGRLWGFLKFHHSEIGKGNYNWDYELFRILPSFLEARNSGERDKNTPWLDRQIWCNSYLYDLQRKCFGCVY